MVENLTVEELNKLNLSDFLGRTREYISSVPACFEDDFLNEALVFFEKNEPVEYLALLYEMSEEEIKKAVRNGADGKAIAEIFVDCIVTERRFYESLYRDECFCENGIGWLPVEAQYNDFLYRFVMDGGSDKSLLLSAAKLRPDMANVISAWVTALQ